MELMHRFGGTVNDSYIDFYIKLLKEHKGSGDLFWLGTPYDFPPLEKHKEYAKYLTEMAKKIRANGIKVSLQVSNTIGHGDSHGSLPNGLGYEGSKAGNVVGADGEVCKNVWCWNSQEVIDYTVKEVEYYAEIKPDVVWVDDDFRYNNHIPVQIGCFCPTCIGKFNKKYGFNYEREDLVKGILADIELRKKWHDFTMESMGNFMYEISKAIHKISPATRMALQGSYFSFVADREHNYIFNAMKKATGLDPYVRPGGGNYTDFYYEAIYDKNIICAMANACLPDYVKRKTAEQESLPFAAMNKTARHNAYESSWFFANGMTDVSYSIMMERKDIDEYYEKMMEYFSKCRKYWDRLAEINTYTHSSGIRFYMPKDALFTPDDGVGTYEERIGKTNKAGCCHMIQPILRDGFPIAFDQNNDDVNLISAETAKLLTDDEIKELLTKNVYIDGEGFAIIQDKVNFGIKASRLDDATGHRVKEVFFPHETLPEGLTSWSYSFYSRIGANEAYKMEDNSGKAEIISLYGIGDVSYGNEDPSKNIEKNNLGIAELIIDTGKGGKWAINGYKPWKRSLSTLKRNQMENVMDYISGYKLCAKMLTMNPVTMYPRETEYGKIVCLSFVNNSSEYIKEKVFVRNTISNKFEFVMMEGKKYKVKAVKEKDGFIVSLPEIAPYTVGTLFCK